MAVPVLGSERLESLLKSVFPGESRPPFPLGKHRAGLGSSQSWGTGGSRALREEDLFTQLRYWGKRRISRVRFQKPTSNPSSQGQAHDLG